MCYIFISFWNELNKLEILLAKITSECPSASNNAPAFLT